MPDRLDQDNDAHSISPFEELQHDTQSLFSSR